MVHCGWGGLGVSPEGGLRAGAGCWEEVIGGAGWSRLPQEEVIGGAGWSRLPQEEQMGETSTSGYGRWAAWPVRL